jgi:glucoamylase
LHWTADEWKTTQDTDARASSLGESFVDIARLPPVGSLVRFTFFWTNRSEWEGRDFAVEVAPAASGRALA